MNQIKTDFPPNIRSICYLCLIWNTHLLRQLQVSVTLWSVCFVFQVFVVVWPRIWAFTALNMCTDITDTICNCQIGTRLLSYLSSVALEIWFYFLETFFHLNITNVSLRLDWLLPLYTLNVSNVDGKIKSHVPSQSQRVLFIIRLWLICDVTPLVWFKSNFATVWTGG